MQTQDARPDLFGDKKNQGANYEKFRPKYPQRFIDEIVAQVPPDARETYLDIATGTGQLLFNVAPFFSRVSVGTDVSETQVKVARGLVEQKNQQDTVKIVHADALTTRDELQKAGLPQRYDLVSIAQALHWLDVDKFCATVKNDLLREDGKGALVVLGYYALGFDFNFEDRELAALGDAFYTAFYDVVGPYFDCDRKELSLGYPSYPFAKYFASVNKQEIVDVTDGTLEDFVNYCKTYSAYNTYLRKFKDAPDFVDPADKLLRDARQKLDEIYATRGEQKRDKEVRFKTYYFLITLK